MTSKLRSVTVKGDERDNSGLQPPWGLRRCVRRRDKSTSTAVLPKLHKKKEKKLASPGGCRWLSVAQNGTGGQ